MDHDAAADQEAIEAGQPAGDMAENHQPASDSSAQLQELYEQVQRNEEANKATKEEMKVMMGTLQSMSAMLASLVQATGASSAGTRVHRPVTQAVTTSGTPAGNPGSVPQASISDTSHRPSPSPSPAATPVATAVTVFQSTLPRMKRFTGSTPQNRDEVNFKEWRTQAKGILSNGNVQDPLGYLRQHLGGQAANIGSKHRTAEGLLEELNNIYGNKRSFDSLMAQLLKDKKQAHDQSPGDLLNEICSELTELRELQKMTQDEFNGRMYNVFQHACTSPSLTCELRARFGTAEQGAPTYAELFSYLQQVEGLSYGRVRDRRPVAPAVVAHPVQQPRAPVPPARANGRGGRKRGSIRCRQCGVTGHIMAQCQGDFNEEAILRYFGEDGLEFYYWKAEQLNEQGNGSGRV